MSDPTDTDRGVLPPSYEPAAVGRVAGAVEILGVELVRANFESEDDQPLGMAKAGSEGGEAQLNVSWDRSTDPSILGYLIRFRYRSEGPPKHTLVAYFRLTYALAEDCDLDDSDLEQFGYWNAVFNAWPYFREHVASTTLRAGLPPTTLPVMRVPRATS